MNCLVYWNQCIGRIFVSLIWRQHSISRSMIQHLISLKIFELLKNGRISLLADSEIGYGCQSRQVWEASRMKWHLQIVGKIRKESRSAFSISWPKLRNAKPCQAAYLIFFTLSFIQRNQFKETLVIKLIISTTIWKNSIFSFRNEIHFLYENENNNSWNFQDMQIIWLNNNSLDVDWICKLKYPISFFHIFFSFIAN